MAVCLHMLLFVGEYHTLTPYSLLKPVSRLIVGFIYVLPSLDEGPVQYDVRKFLSRFVGPALPPRWHEPSSQYLKLFIRLFQKSSLELTTLSSWLSR